MAFTNKKRNKFGYINDDKTTKQLHLVLDLDHTLLHAVHISQLSQKEKYLIEEADSRADLWSFNKGQSSEYLIKLRPFALEFLQEANKLFSMSVYTMGSSDYAKTVLTVIDPKKLYFGDRVITFEQSPYKKTLDLVEADNSRVVILDDTVDVWPDHKENLLEITEYMYFGEANMSKATNKKKQKDKKSKSFAEQKSDESESNGSLANVLKFLNHVHERFQDESDCKDMKVLICDPCRPSSF